jgi:hypothetical protein
MKKIFSFILDSRSGVISLKSCIYLQLIHRLWTNIKSIHNLFTIFVFRPLLNPQILSRTRLQTLLFLYMHSTDSFLYLCITLFQRLLPFHTTHRWQRSRNHITLRPYSFFVSFYIFSIDFRKAIFLSLRKMTLRFVSNHFRIVSARSRSPTPSQSCEIKVSNNLSLT